MTRIVSATQARIRFGELIRWVTETQQPVLVERDGQPCVVVLPVEVYRRMQEAQGRPEWQEVLNQVREFRAQLRARRSGRPWPLPEEVIREMREERDAQLAGLR